MKEKSLVQNWIDTDKKLFNTLVEIQNKTGNDKVQAEFAFFEIPKIYDLPIFPEDNGDQIFYSSVYEHLAFLNYLEPEGDIRAHVLASIFYVKEGYAIDMSLVFEKKFEKMETPINFSGIGFKGESINVSPVFIMKGESWFDLKCKYFTKEIDL